MNIWGASFNRTPLKKLHDPSQYNMYCIWFHLYCPEWKDDPARCMQQMYTWQYNSGCFKSDHKIMRISSRTAFHRKVGYINMCCPALYLKRVTGNVLTNYEDFKYWKCALGEQICTVKTSDRSQMNPKILFNNTVISVQLPYIAGHSL